MKRVYRAHILFTKEKDRFEVLENGCVAVDAEGHVIGTAADLASLDCADAEVVDFGDRLHGCEGCLAALVRVERRDAHEAMDASLGLQHAEGIRPFHAEIDILKPSLFARLAVVLLDLPALILGVSLVHAVEHRNPIARLRSALTCMELHEHVALVELAAEQRLHPDL